MPPAFPYQKKNPIQFEYAVDFATSYKPAEFSNWFGDDGKLQQDGGLVFNSSRFGPGRAAGPNGIFDHYSLALYYKRLVNFTHGKEKMIRGLISNKQVLPDSAPFPDFYRKRIVNAKEDVRLAHGQFSIIDPKTGIEAGFVLSDQQVYVHYARNDALSGCDLKCEQSTDCNTCGLPDDYTCMNFMTDENYQNFKETMSQEDFSRFVLYVKYADWATRNGRDVFDWNQFRSFQVQYPSICAVVQPSNAFVDWLSTDNYTEYCLSKSWKRWIAGYKDFYRCGTPALAASTCANDSCSVQEYGAKPGCSVCMRTGAYPSSCSCKFTGGGNCYETKGKCCCERLAGFADLIPVKQLGACDPYCDLLEVWIGVDRGASIINFYIGSEKVYQVNGIGTRTAVTNRVAEFGGAQKALDMESALIFFGTGRYVDYALPNNAIRWRVDGNDNIAVSALTPTLPLDQYRQIYPSKTGVFGPVVPEQTFGAPRGGERSHSWGQGDVFRIREFSVYSRRPERDIQYPVDFTKSECCGFPSCNMNNTSGCMPNTCEVEEDNLINYIDARDLQVEFLQPPKPIQGDDYLAQQAMLDADNRVAGTKGTSGGAGGEVCIRGRIVKANTPKRMRECGQDFNGFDPSLGA